MADIFSKEKRSEIMSKISGKDTKLEVLVRKYLFKRGYRYRKNVATIIGKPDIVLPKYKLIILIHGCFWHGHKNCKASKLPETRRDFWKMKIEGNKKRDEKVKKELKILDWKVLTVWQCELTSKYFELTMQKLIDKLKQA